MLNSKSMSRHKPKIMADNKERSPEYLQDYKQRQFGFSVNKYDISDRDGSKKK